MINSVSSRGAFRNWNFTQNILLILWKFERCVVYWKMTIYQPLKLRARKCFWNAPPPPPPHPTPGPYFHIKTIIRDKGIHTIKAVVTVLSLEWKFSLQVLQCRYFLVGVHWVSFVGVMMCWLEWHIQEKSLCPISVEIPNFHVYGFPLSKQDGRHLVLSISWKFIYPLDCIFHWNGPWLGIDI